MESFEVDSNDELHTYLGTIVQRLYPGSELSLEDMIDGKSQFKLKGAPKDVLKDLNKLRSEITKIKAEPVMKKCEVVKIGNDYFVYDPETKEKFAL